MSIRTVPIDMDLHEYLKDVRVEDPEYNVRRREFERKYSLLNIA